MIAQVVDNDELLADGAAVAVMGASYGGAHSWLAAVKPVFKTPRQRDVEIRTIVPVAAGSDLLYSLIPNGRPNAATTPAGAVKLSYLNGLFLGGFRPPSQARPYSNYPLYLFRWAAVVNLTEPDYRLPPWRPIVDGIQGYRSVYWQSEFWESAKALRQPYWQSAFWQTPKTNHLPIFQIQGFTDDLFPIHESLRMLDALKSVDANYPIATYFGDIGHPRAANKVDEVSYLIDLILEWLAMTLKGTPPTAPWPDVRVAITRPYEVAFDRPDASKDGDVIEVPIGPDDDIMEARFAALAKGQASYEFTEAKVITFNPTNTSGVRWDPLVLAGAQELKPNPPPLPSDEVPGDVRGCGRNAHHRVGRHQPDRGRPTDRHDHWLHASLPRAAERPAVRCRERNEAPRHPRDLYRGLRHPGHSDRRHPDSALHVWQRVGASGNEHAAARDHERRQSVHHAKPRSIGDRNSEGASGHTDSRLTASVVV